MGHLCAGLGRLRMTRNQGNSLSAHGANGEVPHQSKGDPSLSHRALQNPDFHADVVIRCQISQIGFAQAVDPAQTCCWFQLSNLGQRTILGIAFLNWANVC
jgi:hypothetical protein